MSPVSLSWSLVIATYQREKILPLCLKQAIQQTRQPQEIVIVDASPNWSKTRDKVIAELIPQAPKINWIYEPAAIAGLTSQRNQGLGLATADVLFFFDDDSLMYPDCAEEIMKVYEADAEHIIQGVQASASSEPPCPLHTTDTTKVTGYSQTKNDQPALWQKFLFRNIFLMDTEALFIPYDATYSEPFIPATVSHLKVEPVRLFQGFRMTYRRQALLKTQFESTLLRYAAGEDLDASYRVSRHGPLLEAKAAQVYHYQSSSGRLDRYRATTLSSLNQAFCIAKNAKNIQQKQREFYQLMLRRVLAETLKDLLSRRWSFPQLRGIISGLHYSRQIFSKQGEPLTQWYLQFQQELLR
jgi:GT2 family glycosyltransferase